MQRISVVEDDLVLLDVMLPSFAVGKTKQVGEYPIPCAKRILLLSHPIPPVIVVVVYN